MYTHAQREDREEVPHLTQKSFLSIFKCNLNSPTKTTRESAYSAYENSITACGSQISNLCSHIKCLLKGSREGKAFLIND